MKEQHPYNVTPEEGWAKLKPVLDEVLPEGRSTRRSPIVWWVASAVVMAGLLTLIFIDFDSSKANPAADHIRSAPNLSATNKTLQEIQATEVTSDDTEVSETETISPDVNERQDDDEIDKPAATTVRVKKNTLSNTKEKTGQTPPMAAAIPSTDDSHSPVLIESGVAIRRDVVDRYSQEADLRSVTDMGAHRIMIDELPYASTLPVGPVVSMERNYHLPGGNSIEKQKRIPALFTPTLAVSSLFGQAGGMGVYGGAGVDFNISRKISLTSAIGYASYSPNARLGFANSKPEYHEQNTIINFDPSNEVLNSYVYSGSLNAKTDYSSIKPIIKSISQWQIDIGLNWRLSRRFYTSGGVKFGFHTEAVSQYPIVSGDPAGMPPVPIIAIGNSLNDFNVIRESNTALFFGMGYRLSKHFDIFAHWTHGLNQYVLNDESSPAADLSTGDRTDYIRGLSLGLKYSL